MSIHRPLKYSEVVRFLGAKGASNKCASCGSTKGQLLTEEQTGQRLGLMGFKFPGFDATGAGIYGICAIACTNCGLYRFHARTPIVEWADENRPN